MKRISNREVEFTDDEMLVTNVLDLFLDDGHSTLKSVEMIQQGRVPDDYRKYVVGATRLNNPKFRERVLTPQFLAYLRDEDRHEVPEENAP